MKFIVAMIPLLFWQSIYAQDQEKHRIFWIDAGADFISCAPPHKSYIRGEVDPNWFGYETSSLRGLYYRDYFGIKTEHCILNNKIGLSVGVRYSHSVSSIGKNTYWSSSPNFFYLLYSHEGISTEYLKVKTLTQKAGYMGIPLECRIYPYRPRIFNIYYTLGGDVNLLLTHHTDVEFYNAAMKIHEKDVARILEKPWPFYGSVHTGIGFRWGNREKPGASLEIFIPVTLVPTGKSSLIIPQAGGGFQLNFRLPYSI